MQPLKLGKYYTYAISRYYNIQNIRWYLVSYHNIDLISIYCPVLVWGIWERRCTPDTSNAVFVFFNRYLSKWGRHTFFSPAHLQDVLIIKNTFHGATFLRQCVWGLLWIHYSGTFVSELQNILCSGCHIWSVRILTTHKKNTQIHCSWCVI